MKEIQKIVQEVECSVTLYNRAVEIDNEHSQTFHYASILKMAKILDIFGYVLKIRFIDNDTCKKIISYELGKDGEMIRTKEY